MTAFDVRSENFQLSDIVRDGYDVTPNDSADLPEVCRSLWCDVGGDVHFTTVFGTEMTRTVAAGLFPFGAKKIFATGTTATGICAITK